MRKASIVRSFGSGIGQLQSVSLRSSVLFMQELITFRVSNKEEGKAGRGAARGEIVIPQVSKKRATPTTTPRAESDGMGWNGYPSALADDGASYYS